MKTSSYPVGGGRWCCEALGQVLGVNVAGDAVGRRCDGAAAWKTGICTSLCAYTWDFRAMGCSPVLSPLSVLGAPLPAAGPVLLKQWEVAGVFPGSHILTRAALAHCAAGLRSCLLGPAASQLPGQQCCPCPAFPLFYPKLQCSLLQSLLKCDYWASTTGAEVFIKRLAFHSLAKSTCSPL